MHWKSVLAALVVTSSFFTATVSQAAILVNETNAGELLGTAQITNLSAFAQPQVNIVGSLADSFTGQPDLADVYRVFLTAGTYNATTVGLTSTDGTGDPFDSQLFLFDGSGKALFSNDNAPISGAVESSLDFSVGTSGVYYLAISLYDYDPVNANALFLFPDTDSLLNPTQTSASSLADLALSSFALNQTEPLIGGFGTASYTIRLTAAEAVPEPASTAGLLFLGGFGLLTARRRHFR
jgi:hypothetical protein